MNRNNLARQQYALAQRRLAQASIPRGAQAGALGRAEPPSQPVPQGADAGNLAGCFDGGCNSGFIPSAFPGMSPYVNAPYYQPSSLLGIFVQPATAAPTTIEASCGNTFFNGCGARTFTPENSILLTEIVSGFDTRNNLCPGAGIDVAYFRTDDCYCPFFFGCFSNLAPLLITFDPIDTQSVLQPLNMVIVGERLEFDGCFPFPPGLWPTPVPVPGVDWQPPNMPVPQMAAPSGPAVNPGFYGSPWHRQMRGF